MFSLDPPTTVRIYGWVFFPDRYAAIAISDIGKIMRPHIVIKHLVSAPIYNVCIYGVTWF